MSSSLDLLTPEPTGHINDQTALACYLSAVVAIGNCVAEVCPSVGVMYRDRLLKLPRRLGFDATPQALKQSREAVETDLLEYSRAARAWIDAGSAHAALLLQHLQATEETLVASADLLQAFLEDLADHISTSAEVDEEAQLRVSFKRYAAGLSAYSRRARLEKLATVDDLRRRRNDIEAWLAEATESTFLDAETGFLNRAAAERRIQTLIEKGKPFCVIIVALKDGGAAPIQEAGRAPVMKGLGDRLAATIRPYDIIFRWSPDLLATIFEASQTDIAARAQQIAGWLGDGAKETHAIVSVVEHFEEESASQFIARVESVTQIEVSAK
jgi:GGDEF domain-containing protein